MSTEIPRYMNDPQLKAAGVKMAFTLEQLQEIQKCKEDIVYFARNYMKILHIDKGIINFEMWEFQENMIRTFHNNRFSIAKLPRQSGKCDFSEVNITVRNKLTGEVKNVPIGEFYQQRATDRRTRTIQAGSNSICEDESGKIRESKTEG